MKLLFMLSIALWIVRKVFSYVCFALGGNGLAAMQLRGELWKWNGTEQRMIARQLQKNRV